MRINQRFSLPLSVVFLPRLIRLLSRKTTGTSRSGCCWGRGWNAKALTGILKISTQIYTYPRTGKAGMALWVTPNTHYIWFDYLSWIDLFGINQRSWSCIVRDLTVWPACREENRKERLFAGVDVHYHLFIVADNCWAPFRSAAQESNRSALITTLQTTIPQAPNFLCSAATAREATR